MSVAPIAVEQLAVNADDAAKIYGISKRHFLRLVKEGKLVQPVRFGGSPRWIIALLREHLEKMQPKSEPKQDAVSV